MIHRILHLGETGLRETAEPITQIDEQVRRLVDDMFETMDANRGCGLAATQIGVNLRVAVLEVEEKHYVLINPEITKATGKEVCEEGCLSLPGLRESVQRATAIVCRATNLEGDLLEYHAGGLLARAMQHEIDHLDGVLFIDRISKARRLQLKAEFELLKQGKRLDDPDDPDESDEIASDSSPQTAQA